MFGIENSRDRLAQLKSNFQLLKQDELNVSLAEATCSDAWHLIDWVYEERKSVDSTLSKEKFRVQVYNDCPEIEILHDLVNSFKHKNLVRPKVKIVKTGMHRGGFSSGFSRGFNISALEVQLEDGSKIDLEKLVEIVVHYWDETINWENDRPKFT